MEERVFTVFADVLELSADADKSTLVYNESKGWDSLGHMRIIAGVEEDFDCMLETGDILDMSSFEKAVSIMEKYA